MSLVKSIYDLSNSPASFNFMEFLGAAVALGANHVCFDTRKGVQLKYSEGETAERISSILIPCCDIMGVSWSDDHDELNAEDPANLIDPGYHFSAMLYAWRKTGRMGFVKHWPSLSEPAPQYTVTLRNYDRFEFRNSDVKAWERFALAIGAHIIPDYGDEKIPFEKKVALWANAKMNFFVNNGPANICYLSDFPYLSFFKWFDKPYHEAMGFSDGSQFPWATSNQRLLWEMDSYDNLMRAFEAYLKGEFA